MHRVYEAARENGYLAGLPPLVSEEHVGDLPRRGVLLLCTGSQGERRSGLWRLAQDENPNISLEPDDAVVFSSRIIPGNDTAIFSLQNELVRKGLRVITDDEHFIHVSGHPAREELSQMYQWVRPRIAVPVHGEPRHLAEHARLAQACQVPRQIVGENGTLIRLAPEPAGIVDRVTAGRLAFDGNRLLAAESTVLRTRQRMAFNGAAVATLVLDRHGALRDAPQIAVQGLLDGEVEADRLAEVAEALREALRRLPAAARRDDETVKETARLAIRRAFNRMLGKKPVTEVHLVRGH
ncbi:MAG: MBL fold metallo-hydrolase RNA specificity domain-containing protein, partial [Kiloniellaceae bacterium]